MTIADATLSRRVRLPRILLKKAVPMIFQSETTECALACLAMISNYHGQNVTIAYLRRRHPSSLRGLTMRHVIELATDLRLHARPLKAPQAVLNKLRLPALLHWDFEHMVVLTELRPGKRYCINDPARGQLTLSEEELLDHYTGIALELSPAPEFSRSLLATNLRLHDIYRTTAGLGKSLLRIFWLSAFVEIFSLALPIASNAVLSSKGSHSLQGYLSYVIGILLLSLSAFAITQYLRDKTSLAAGADLAIQLARQLFFRLMALPLAFFERRQINDIIDRYMASEHIRQIMIGELPLIMLEGLFALGALGLLFFYSVSLGLVALAFASVYGVFRVLGFRRQESLTERATHARSAESGYVQETLRGIVTLKTSVGETNRKIHWLKHYGDVINADYEIARLKSFQRAGKVLINGLDYAVTLYLGVEALGEGSIAIGALFAIFLLKANLSSKSSLFIERLIDLRLIDIYLRRMSDIVFADTENYSPDTSATIAAEPYSGLIEIRNVGFRYSAKDLLVIAPSTITINAKEFVAVIGKTGAGKTTLIKLLLALYQPTEGCILFDGATADNAGLLHHRSQFGVVMQDDQLITGSLAENITFFDSAPNLDKIVECATVAGIHADIVQMPMGYGTKVGQLSSALSGGQCQRLFLARALYRSPPILVFDEGTANLDPVTEDAILKGLRSLSSTIVFITHSDKVIHAADRILEFENGFIREINKSRQRTA